MRSFDRESPSIPPRGARWKARAVVVLVLLLVVAATVCASDDATVRRAHDLRLEGRAGEALAMLEEVVAANPRDAAATFELARTRHHMMLSNPQEIAQTVLEVRRLADRAAALEPDNLVFARYRCLVGFLEAYVALREGSDEARMKVASLCQGYEEVLARRPDCTEAMLYLVEIHGSLPANYGTSRATAAAYAERLETLDPVCGAKARALLLADDEDAVAFWTRVRAACPGEDEVLVELGKAYLRSGDTVRGEECLEQALERNPDLADLHLDIARHHLLAVWRGEGDAAALTEAGERHIARYLQTDPVRPLQGYALGMSAKLARLGGDSQGARQAELQALNADPFHSRATGMPPAELYTGLDEEVTEHRYLLRAY